MIIIKRTKKNGFGEIGKHFPLKMEWNYILKSSSLLIRILASTIVYIIYNPIKRDSVTVAQ
jgi:hypothetical protein